MFQNRILYWHGRCLLSFSRISPPKRIDFVAHDFGMCVCVCVDAVWRERGCVRACSDKITFQSCIAASHSETGSVLFKLRC